MVTRGQEVECRGVNCFGPGSPAASIFQYFVKFAEIINHFDETSIESQIRTQQEKFARFSLPDPMLLVLSNNPSLILLTKDLWLYLAAMNRGLKAETFNHQGKANSS
ncbi:MAG: hypothetical protein ACREDT_08300 [Methylocella sp.]